MDYSTEEEKEVPQESSDEEELFELDNLQQQHVTVESDDEDGEVGKRPQAKD